MSDRILVALCAAFVCHLLAELTASFPRFTVAIFVFATFGLIALALIWWVQKCLRAKTSSDSIRLKRST